ncbi:MAG: patatin-like phospholipase family protein [Elusimicrobia bacterium]|nr:patatin-like phospholipase family protein [Elusimicrobiota bacterium]
MTAFFRRPLGLLLSGGGSHGAWQAGCLDSLRAAGLAFDKVFGFSTGALTGVSYLLGREDAMLERYRSLDERPILRWEPRLGPHPRFPLSLYSSEPLREALEPARDDEEAKRRARCELTVVSYRVRERALDYARFTPGGAAGWDGPLLRRVLGSCAVPFIFPPVAIETREGRELLVDGGVPAKEPMRFDALHGCQDVVLLQMVRPEERGSWSAWARRGLDQLGRETCLSLMDRAQASLASAPRPPRVFRVFPSEVLDYDQLRFRGRECAAALELGRRDGAAFLRFAVRSKPGVLG